MNHYGILYTHTPTLYIVAHTHSLPHRDMIQNVDILGLLVEIYIVIGSTQTKKKKKKERSERIMENASAK